jgi:hypothetical protein
MYDTIKDAEVRKIMTDPALDPHERVQLLSKLRDDARAEQRLASEAPAVDDDGLNSRLREVELVLDRLGQAPAEQEGKGPASL